MRMRTTQKWLALLLSCALLCSACVVSLAEEDEMDTMGGMTLKTFIKKFGVALKIAYKEYYKAEEKSQRVRYSKIKPKPVYAKENERNTVAFSIGNVNFYAVTFEDSDIMESICMEYEKGDSTTLPDPMGESYYPLIMSILLTPERLAEDLKDPIWASLTMLTNSLYVTSLLPDAPAESGRAEGVLVATDYLVKFEKTDTADRYTLTLVYIGDNR